MLSPDLSFNLAELAQRLQNLLPEGRSLKRHLGMGAEYFVGEAAVVKVHKCWE